MCIWWKQKNGNCKHVSETSLLITEGFIQTLQKEAAVVYKILFTLFILHNFTTEVILRHFHEKHKKNKLKQIKFN